MQCNDTGWMVKYKEYSVNTLLSDEEREKLSFSLCKKFLVIFAFLIKIKRYFVLQSRFFAKNKIVSVI